LTLKPRRGAHAIRPWKKRRKEQRNTIHRKELIKQNLPFKPKGRGRGGDVDPVSPGKEVVKIVDSKNQAG